MGQFESSHPSGAKAREYFATFMRGLKPVPFKMPTTRSHDRFEQVSGWRINVCLRASLKVFGGWQRASGPDARKTQMCPKQFE